MHALQTSCEQDDDLVIEVPYNNRRYMMPAKHAPCKECQGGRKKKRFGCFCDQNSNVTVIDESKLSPEQQSIYAAYLWQQTPRR